jgi:DNA mismatch repair protein MutS
MPGETSPSMQQYLAAKADHPDCVVLFRMGDFYETFFEDAVEVSRLLDLTLTSRNRDDPNPIPMAGVPYHAVSGYISRLIEAGRRVAICEQMEDPRQAKGIVRREVVRVITPGVLLDSELGDSRRANHLACVLKDARGFAIAALDASTGALTGAFATSMADLRTALGRLDLREVLVQRESADPEMDTLLAGIGSAMRTPLGADDMDPARLPTVIAALLPDAASPESLRCAAAALLTYLGRTHPLLCSTVRPFASMALGSTMTLPATTVRNLELLSTVLGDRTSGSLLSYLDKTLTSMGGRLIRAWLLAPLVEPVAIFERLDRVQGLVDQPVVRAAVRDALAGISDVERVLTRLAAQAASARDLNAMARGVRALQASAAALDACGVRALSGLADVPSVVADIATGIEATFVPDPPATIKDGGMVRRTVSLELDEARDMAGNGRQYIANYESGERERTGIPSLRIRHNRVFGFTIEVTRSQTTRVPPEYQRRQTLAGAERYTTVELQRLQDQVATSDERSKELEYQHFETWRGVVLDARQSFQAVADALSRIDVIATLAELAATHSWCRPIVDEGRGLMLREARHPIVEASLPAGSFVPNDFEMNGVSTTLSLLTGPNMAGKSTVMRQIAISVLLAQMGSYVPAKEARIGVVDAIWTRVGAMDDLASGRSTFMVEMSEASEVLARATDRSLVVLDEIGRGTSTFDGVAIAWAVAEHVQNRIGCRTLFATHYHELTDLVRSVPRTRNQSMAVKEWGGEVLFLRKLVDGPASKSYGIQVARLAGMPAEVVARAREVLSNLEAVELDVTGQPVIGKARKGAAARAALSAQLDMFGAATEPARPDPIITRLAGLTPDRIAPIEALQILSDLVAKASAQITNRGG